MSKKVMIINGPNLNTLGKRQVQIYGKNTLADIKSLCVKEGKSLSIVVDFRQSNVEGEIVNWIQEAAKKCDGIIINAAAYTHTSVAIMDALLALEIPVVEVHLSNLFKREKVRHHSYISQAAKGMICGFGSKGYALALRALKDLI